MDARSGRRTRPGFEGLGARALLSQVLPPLDENGQVLPPQVLAAAYHAVQASEVVTLRSLGATYQRVGAAYARFRGEVAAGPAFVRGTADVDRFVNDLQVAVGVEQMTTTNAESSLRNGLFTDVRTIVEAAATTGAAIARSGHRHADATVARLDALRG